jgi:hypothetical protein
VKNVSRSLMINLHNIKQNVRYTPRLSIIILILYLVWKFVFF